ncbi:MAG: hypothetical protein HKO59_09265 [Phycisphaerales bacterium]|nr:hypothetical protein [Phycisphaerales bacterium]NNM26158.1 hypothetical protein [Phycisphaerales bacterium]
MAKVQSRRRVNGTWTVIAALIGVLGTQGGPGGHVMADEIVVRNDSFESGQSAVIVGDFIAFEQAGARLTSPCDGDIVAVQVGWLDFFGTSDPTIEEAIHIYRGETFPTPGPEIVELFAPLMTPGALNEFRQIDDMGTPLSVPVVEGQQFYVTLQFANPTDIAGGSASVFRDTDGCTSGSNVLFAIPGGWTDFCVFLAGDLVIRAVIDCPSVPLGACCLPTDCIDPVTVSDCADFGGTWLGPDSDCTGEACPGACCLGDGTCVPDQSASDCATAAGEFQGEHTSCDGFKCPEAVGACCIPATEGCLDRTEKECGVFGGIWSGPGTDCGSFVCFPSGACCLPDGSCSDDSDPDACADAGGVFQGDEVSCGDITCPAPEGACCIPATGLCSVESEGDCRIGGGLWQGGGTDCADDDGNGTADACEDAKCAADVDGSGDVGFTDLLQVVALWGPCAGCPQDIDGDGTVSFVDLLLVLSSWGPCT